MNKEQNKKLLFCPASTWYWWSKVKSWILGLWDVKFLDRSTKYKVLVKI